MTTNGTAALASQSIAPTIEAPDAAADLDQYEDGISALGAALTAITYSRGLVEDAALTLERIEAGHVIDIEGGNADTRKARLTPELADDARYEAARKVHREARETLATAERAAELSRQRLRLLRLAIEQRIAVQQP
jgi:hypothetical protein